MCGKTSVMKEIHSLIRRKDKLYDGQVDIELDDGENNQEGCDENLVKFLLNITPNCGLYKNAKCIFKVYIDSRTYPSVPPEVKCLHEIYHPNIDMLDDDGEGSICVSLLSEDWLPGAGLDGCVNAVLFLFYNPQLDDALNPVCNDFADWSEYEEKVGRALRGEITDGFPFDRLVPVEIDEKDFEEKSKIRSPVEGMANDVGEIKDEMTKKDPLQMVLEKDTSPESDQSQTSAHILTMRDELPHILRLETTKQSKSYFLADGFVESEQSQDATQRT